MLTVEEVCPHWEWRSVHAGCWKRNIGSALNILKRLWTFYQPLFCFHYVWCGRGWSWTKNCSVCPNFTLPKPVFDWIEWLCFVNKGRYFIDRVISVWNLLRHFIFFFFLIGCLILRPQNLILTSRNQFCGKLLFSSKTTLLQREPSLTMFYTINISPLPSKFLC